MQSQLQTGAARSASPVDEAEMKLVRWLRRDNWISGNYIQS